MIPILFGLGIAATALFASGCGSNKSSRNSEDQNPSDGSLSSSSSTSSAPSPTGSLDLGPPSPPPSFVAVFGKDLRAASAYQKLLISGATNADIDVGCFSEKNLLGKGDSRIEPCETRTFAVNNSERFPEAIQALGYAPLPWVLDDGDPKTDTDKNIRVRVQSAIDALRSIPAIKDNPADSDKHRELMALGLFYFLDFPENPPKTVPQIESTLRRTQELRDVGLSQFQEFLMKNGGLGTSEYKNDRKGNPNYTALESLQYRQGSDFSKSALLYGVLEAAGLNPVFARSSMKYSHADKEYEYRGGLIWDFYIGVRVSGTNFVRTFLPHTSESQSKDPASLPRTHLDFLALFFTLKGQDLLDQGRYRESIFYSEEGLNLRPMSAYAYANLGDAYLHEGKTEEAEISLREAIRGNPQYVYAHETLGNLLIAQGRREEGLEHYLLALKSPHWIWLSSPKNQILTETQKTLQDNPNHATAKVIVKMFEDYTPKNK